MIWSFLSLAGFIVLIYAYVNVFIYNPNLTWSEPNSNNSQQKSFGGYQRYTKDAKLNAESDNNKSYKDFEAIVENLQTNFFQRSKKSFIVLRDPMNPIDILESGNSEDSKGGYSCIGYVKVESGEKIGFSYQNTTKYIQLNGSIGNATLVEINDNTAILELNNTDKTRLDFKIKKY